MTVTSTPASDNLKKSKYFLSRFLASAPHEKTASVTTASDTYLPPHTTHSKVKKNKGLGKRLLRRFTKNGSDLDPVATNWHKTVSSDHQNQHHSSPSVNTTLTASSTSLFNNNGNNKVTDRSVYLGNSLNTQRRRSSTLPDSVIYSSSAVTPVTAEPEQSKDDGDDTDGESVYSAFTGLSDQVSDHRRHKKLDDTVKHDSLQQQQQQQQQHIPCHELDDDEDDNASSGSSSDESFVDASEEVDAAHHDNNNKKKRTSLTHRLSAGRFSSAGGLVVNMHPSLRNHRSNTSMVQHLRKSTPPDDLTQAMLNWKRKSGDGIVNKRASSYSDSNKAKDIQRLNPSSANSHQDQNYPSHHPQHQESLLSVLSSATSVKSSLSSTSLISRTVTNDTNTGPILEENDKDQEGAELSKEDREASRAHAENILMGNATTTAVKTTSAPSSRLHHERSRSIKALSEMFSKSLDKAWNNDSTSSQLSQQVLDPRLSTMWVRPAHLSVKAKETAKRIWDNDESFMPSVRVAEWLGQRTPFNAETLVCYMDLFYFTNMQLDSAFRKLCSKLYFKAEAQQIDRILEVFAYRYWDCNPLSILKCADIVYAVVYSILLLNTDLHVAKGSHHRMTKQEFVKNTLMAIHSQMGRHPELEQSNDTDTDLESYLKEIYVSVKNYQILQPLSDEITISTLTNNAKGSLRHVASLKRGVNSIIRRAGRESMMVDSNDTPIIPRPSSPLSSFSSTRSSSLSPQSVLPPLPPSSSSRSFNNSQRVHTSTRRLSRSLSVRQAATIAATTTISSPRYHRSNGSLTSIGSSTVSSVDGSSPSTTVHEVNDKSKNLSACQLNRHRSSSISNSSATVSPTASSSTLFTAGTFLQDVPFAKESVVMCKHLLKRANQKSKSREWKEQVMVLDDQGVLKLYDLPVHKETERIVQGSIDLLRPINHHHHHHHYRHTRKHIEGPLSKFDPSWNDYLTVTIELIHTLSNVLPPPGYNKNRPFVFALQQADGGVYLFQGTTLEDVASWVSTCNYWAARQSKEPLQGGVSNMDYGWGSCLDNVIVDLDAVQNGDSFTGNTVGADNPDAATIYDWQPPTAPTVASSYINDAPAQLAALKAHLHWLHCEINEHREIKTKMLVKFPKRSFNYKKALSNWSLKSSYLLGEIIKYQHYCDALEQTLQNESSLLGSTDCSNTLAAGYGGALDNIGLIDFHDMDLIKEIESELDL